MYIQFLKAAKRLDFSDFASCMRSFFVVLSVSSKRVPSDKAGSTYNSYVMPETGGRS